MNRPLALLSLLAAVVASPNSVAGHPREARTSLPPNVPVDTDGNGLVDWVWVSDWDGDGALELRQDLQAAIDTLDDPGPKLVQVGPGTFHPPAGVVQESCIVELPSNLTLEGSGAGSTILRGFPPGNLTATAAVLGNRRLPAGAHDVSIRSLQIDGGGVGTTVAYAGHSRMGIYLDGCTRCSVEGVTLHDTLHACLYSKNGREVTLRDNTLTDCGTNPFARYPCIYLYASSGRSQEDVVVAGNHCSRSGAPGISTRRQDPSATQRRIVITGNTVEDTLTTAGVTAECVNVSGARDVLLADTTCRRTGPFRVGSGDTYYSSGSDARSSADVVIDGLEIIDARQSGLQVLDHLERATVRQVHVKGTGSASSCIEFQNPLYHVEFEGLWLEDCGRAGVAQISDAPSGTQEGEGLTFRDVAIARVDRNRQDPVPWPGMVFRGETRWLELDGVAVDDASGAGVVFLGSVVDSTAGGLDVHDVGGHAVHLASGSSGMVLGPIQATEVAGDGVRLSHDTSSSGWTFDHSHLILFDATLAGIGGHGVATSDGVSLHDVEIEGVAVAGVGGSGVRLALAQSPPSQAVLVHGNSIQGFGRAAPGSAIDRGIHVSGSGTDIAVRENLIVDDLAQFAVAYALSDVPDDLGFLCTNRVEGLRLEQWFWVPASPLPFDEDSDGDTHVDGCDNCDAHPNPDQADDDRDRVGDLCDNCPVLANVSQSDLDGDGTGERCDLDDGRIYFTLIEGDWVEWQDEEGVDTFNLYGGDLDVLRTSGLYTQAPGSNANARASCGLSMDGAFVHHVPAPGAELFFLVSGTTAGLEGDLGTDSDGHPRPHSYTCP